ncbi:jg22263 [Pararge aegeria aegeria]|uniref:Jg22263 protein n=1 Tax=Pararge aegeria aegeria TaxID=348720 RepID=A0A8S4S4S3_9NEOP|nr:jg22263 [Pararge aegeria aegeria]
MDDTQASMRSTTDAAATRKRRSSILKSQRPPRTPLSELEFNVATPTDTAKSRRVSFSRRTGVAEFVTNEGTTTWKNFYEEHNKSLENSGNESVANAPRHMSIGHIGKRIFDQQFEEVEIVDIGGILQPKTLAHDFHTSLNNLNITQQLASLECQGDDRKLTAPLQNFDLSSLTDHQSKVFRDDLSIPTMPEMSNPIDINFSMRPMNSKDNCDDLDEIVKDLGRMQPTNVVCAGPFNGNNMSEYIEIDLNMTHVALKNDDCEMSITDTIRNPEVQEVSKSISSIHNERKLNDENDWIVDKENIVINPYVTPKESKKFNINESSDKILVFDGKKLTVKSERETLSNLEKKCDYRSTLLPDTTDSPPKRKTIVLNTDDDLPNFMFNKSIINQSIIGNQEADSPKDLPPFKQSIVIYNECDMSITQAVNNEVKIPKRQTIVFEDDMGNISITQAVPAKVIINKQEKRKTIIYENDNANISVTQVVPTNIMAANKTIVEKSKTVVYEDDISFTQALPGNLILNDNTKKSQDNTMYYQDDYNISVTQAVPENILHLAKNESNSNITISQANKKVKPNDSAMTVIYDGHANEDIEITQAVSDNILLPLKKSSEKRKTLIFEDDAGDISVTQAVPANIMLETLEAKRETNPESLKTEDTVALNKSSVHSAYVKAELHSNDQIENIEKNSNRRKTIIYDDEAGDISMTQVMPSNIIVESEIGKMEISSDHNIADLSLTRALPSNIYVLKSENGIKDELSSLLPNIDCNAKNISTNFNTSKKKDVLVQLIEDNNTKRYSELRETSGGNLSITKPIPSIILDFQKEITSKGIEVRPAKKLYTETELLKDNLSIKQDIFIYQAAEQSISESEKESSVVACPSGTSIKESNESVVCKENFSVNNSYDSKSKKSLNCTKINESFIEEKQSIDYESEHQKNSMVIRQSITRYLDEKLKGKKSFLNELLDMSNASLETVAKSDVISAEPGVVVDTIIYNNVSPNSIEKSTGSLFVITSDNEDDVEDGNSTNNKSEQLQKSFVSEPKQEITKNIPTNEYLEESEDVRDLHNKIAELKAVNQSKRTSNNRHYERVVSSDLYDDKESLNKSEVNEKRVRKSKKSFVNADDTRELLKMLSDFTEGTTDESEKDNSIAKVDIKESLPIEKKYEPSRIIPIRQSLSREQLLCNISMAKAALQQSQFEIDEDESLEESQDSPEEIHDSPEETIEDDKSRRKSVRISNEVVKTLQFEEEDSCLSEESLKSGVKISLLKKTAFGETTYMRENKTRVIPSYLKDVSDNLKDLMNDLVKPMADVMPFESVGLDKSFETTGSTCSTQMQANLMTSSQIDVDVELHSNAESVENIKNIKTNRSPCRVIEKPALTNNADRSLTRSFQSLSASMKVDHSPILQTSIKRPIPQSTENEPVIVFDHSNPLNNVLLAPIDGVKVHKYNPIRSTETMHSERENFTEMEVTNVENIVEVERLSTHYNVEGLVCQRQSTLQSGDVYHEKVKDTSSLASNISKPLSIDRSTDGLLIQVTSTEVNTLIAMKENKEILEASSSLTLVDDALAQSILDVEIESRTSKGANKPKSPLRVIYQMETDGELLQKVNSDATSNIETDEENDITNTRKRSYSPTKRNEDTANNSNIELTPKPINKMQKMSNSPREHKKINDRLDKLLLCLDKMESVPNIPDGSVIHDESPKKRSPKRDKVIVQRVRTECTRDARTDKSAIESIDSSKNVAESVSVEIASSYTSKEAIKIQDGDRSPSNPSSNPSMNWETEINEPSSRNISACSSNVNVVDRINMLKFMGRECEWESSGGDVWMFRLLRSRVRITARLSHRHHNASRSLVLSDTPLEAVTVEPIGPEIKDPIAALCVRFAAEAMRYESAREGQCARAQHVPALLQRCARVARIALRWARAMRDARYHLAYTASKDGAVTLKVANFPLRSVWEVRFRMELVVGDAEQVAWPCATDVRACSVLADTKSTVDVAKLADQMPRDWRHAPATIWSVFRYLKNKTSDDDHFLGLL